MGSSWVSDRRDFGRDHRRCHCHGRVDLLEHLVASRLVGPFGHVFWVCHDVTQLALQSKQERIHVVRSTKLVRKIPTELSSTPAMDRGHMNVVLKWCMCMLLVDLGIDTWMTRIIITIIITISIIITVVIITVTRNGQGRRLVELTNGS